MVIIVVIVGFVLLDEVVEDSYNFLFVLRGEKFEVFIRGLVIYYLVSGYFVIWEGKWKLNMFCGFGGFLKFNFVELGLGEFIFELYDFEVDLGEM